MSRIISYQRRSLCIRSTKRRLFQPVQHRFNNPIHSYRSITLTGNSSSVSTYNGDSRYTEEQSLVTDSFHLIKKFVHTPFDPESTNVLCYMLIFWIKTCRARRNFENHQRRMHAGLNRKQNMYHTSLKGSTGSDSCSRDAASKHSAASIANASPQVL